MKLEIAPTFHYETILRPALDPPLLLQQRPALRPPPLRYLSLSPPQHIARDARSRCRYVKSGAGLGVKSCNPACAAHADGRAGTSSPWFLHIDG